MAASADDDFHVGLALTAGLSGVGADLGVNVERHLGVRATFAGLSPTFNGTYGTTASWNGTVKLLQEGALADIYPWGETFRLSAGIVREANKVTLTAVTTGSDTINLNGNQYVINGGGTASVDFSKTAPYVGLGWGNLGGSAGFHFTTDFGALLGLKPQSSLNLTCNSLSGSGGTTSCSNFSVDLTAEQNKLQSYANKVQVWPVVRFGIGYAF